MLENMASVTLENSYVSTGKDMGKSHEKAHSKQHKYLQKDEPNIVTLTSNKSEDSSVDLAMKMAVKMGVKDEDEWEEYNSKLRKDRRKDSYEEYVAGVSGNLVKNKRRKLSDKKHILSKLKREQIAQELAYIDNNKGIPIDGSLYYISNTMMYDNMKPEELKKYREFERATLTEFYNSKTFKEMNPQNIRSEIHFDENGAIHLQTQDTWFHKDKRGRMSCAKRAEIKQILIKKYGSEQRLNDHLDVLSHCHELYDKKKGSKDRIGSPTVASKFWEFKSQLGLNMGIVPGIKVDDEGNKYPFKYTQAERTTRIEELWRMEQQKALAEIATQKAKEMGVNWKLDEVYTTDGIHRNGPNYVEHKRSMTQTNTELAHKQDELADTQSIVKQAQEALRASYKQLTGKDAVNDKNEPMSPLECSKAINKVIEDKKQEKEQVDNDVNTAKQEAEQQRKLADEQQNRLNEIKNSIKQANDEFDDVNNKINQRKLQRQRNAQHELDENNLFYGDNEPVTAENVDDVEKLIDSWREEQRDQWYSDKLSITKSKKQLKDLTAQNKKLLDKNTDLVGENANYNIQNMQLKKQVDSLKQSKSTLQQETTQLNQQKSLLQQQVEKLETQVKSVGLIIGQWVRKNFKKLENGLDDFARQKQFAQNERLYGGPNGRGDAWTAREYEDKAKKALFNTFDSVEIEEQKQAGIYQAPQRNQQQQSTNRKRQGDNSGDPTWG